MTVDTLAVAQRLTGDGMPTEQAEAVAGSFRDVTALDRTDLLDRFATREDLLELKQELLAAETDVKLVAMEEKLIRWTVGAVLSAAGVALAIARLI